MTHQDHGSNDAEPATGELIGRLTQQSTELIRSEIRLAQAEMTQKAQRAGLGVGLFGGAGLVALYGVGALLATIVLALSLVLDPWLAALIVTVVLLLVAGILALVGKRQVSQATPAAPQQTIDNLKQDIATLKGGSST
jgi:uncharacterized membrane protein YqjE